MQTGNEVRKKEVISWYFDGTRQEEREHLLWTMIILLSDARFPLREREGKAFLPRCRVIVCGSF